VPMVFVVGKEEALCRCIHKQVGEERGFTDSLFYSTF
jgi:hypothetical protein